jgi:phage tail-like protein
MGQQARSRELAGQYNFLVEDLSGGLSNSKYRDVSGGDVNFEIALNREGGAVYAQKMATIANVDDITLSVGLIPSGGEMYDWLLENCDVLASMPEGAGVDDPYNLRTLAIAGLSRGRRDLIAWNCHNCQVAGYPMFQFDNNSGDILIEQLILAYEYPTVEFLG